MKTHISPMKNHTSHPLNNNISTFENKDYIMYKGRKHTLTQRCFNEIINQIDDKHSTTDGYRERKHIHIRLGAKAEKHQSMKIKAHKDIFIFNYFAEGFLSLVVQKAPQQDTQGEREIKL